MAVPVAMACYLAWRDPSRVAGKFAGLTAAAGGALIGAGLGYTCATGMLAVATTLAGAVAGANLALIGCDIAAETLRQTEIEIGWSSFTSGGRNARRSARSG
jgi:hypothetical protein